MTETQTALFVIFVLAPAAGGLLVYAAHAAYRRDRPRATTTREPVHLGAPVPPTDPDRTMRLPLVRQLVHRRPPRPAVWAGATPGWSPADAVAQVDGDPNLITPAMHMVADHDALAPISVALDEFEAHVSDALAHFLRDDPQTLLRLPSSVESTSEWDAAVLRELLDAEDQKLVAPC